VGSSTLAAQALRAGAARAARFDRLPRRDQKRERPDVKAVAHRERDRRSAAHDVAPRDAHAVGRAEILDRQRWTDAQDGVLAR
jgi:hypothetical protein